MSVWKKNQGFSLVEFMIAMTAGLIVIGAVTVFAVSTGKSTSSNIRAARVMQDMRSALSLIEREVRRSGFDEKALSYAGACVDVATNCPLSTFSSVVVSTPTCLIVSYDKATSTNPGTVVAGEYHAYRLYTNSSGVGTIQANLTDDPPDCASASTAWQDVTNADVSNITALQFIDRSKSGTPAVGGCVRSRIGLYAYVQDIEIQITGSWKDPAGIVTQRTLDETVRVRNDRVSTTNPGGCT